MNRLGARYFGRFTTGFGLVIALLWATETTGQSDLRRRRYAKPTPTPGGVARPTPTPKPLPDLRPEVRFNRIRAETRADGTPCGIWNVYATAVNYELVPIRNSFQMVLERRSGLAEAFVEACDKCTFTIGPMVSGEVKYGPARQFNDCGYGPAYSPDFRVLVDIHNTVKELNERNNVQVRSFPRVD